MSSIKTLMAAMGVLCALSTPDANAAPLYSLASVHGALALPALFTARGDAGVATGTDGHHAAPMGLQNGAAYLYVSNGGSITIDVDASSFSFMWGSPDWHNALAFNTSLGDFAYDGMQLASQFGVSNDGDRTLELLFTASMAGGLIHSVTLTSSGTSFEVAAVDVPEPATPLLAATALGAMAFASRRRRPN